jgi:NADH-quinone oxidoreductase subunit J
MSGAEILFLVCAVLAVVGALAVISSRNVMVSAVCLIATFFAVAVSYVLLQATFLGAIQVLVYAGAVMVLYVFVIMVLDAEPGGPARGRGRGIGRGSGSRRAYHAVLGLGIVYLAWVLVGTLARQYVQVGADLSREIEFGTARGVGRLLFGPYVYAFEAVSLLLLAAVVGAMVVARSRGMGLDEVSPEARREKARLEAGPAPDPRLTGEVRTAEPPRSIS